MSDDDAASVGSGGGSIVSYDSMASAGAKYELSSIGASASAALESLRRKSYFY